MKNDVTRHVITGGGWQALSRACVSFRAKAVQSPWKKREKPASWTAEHSFCYPQKQLLSDKTAGVNMLSRFLLDFLFASFLTDPKKRSSSLMIRTLHLSSAFSSDQADRTDELTRREALQQALGIGVLTGGWSTALPNDSWASENASKSKFQSYRVIPDATASLNPSLVSLSVRSSHAKGKSDSVPKEVLCIFFISNLTEGKPLEGNCFRGTEWWSTVARGTSQLRPRSCLAGRLAAGTPQITQRRSHGCGT
jgi:hypothetical protein